MTTRDSKDDAGPARIRPPLMQTAIALGVYIGMYLAVAGVIHVVGLLDATVVAASTSEASVDETRPSDTRDQGTNCSPERRPNVASIPTASD